VDFAKEDQLAIRSSLFVRFLKNITNLKLNHIIFSLTSDQPDAIDRDNLYRAMEEIHIPRKLIALVRATIRKTRCQIEIQNMQSSPIITRNGVRRGDSLACLLFNIALEKVVRDAGINTRFRKQIQFPKRCVFCL
jgi:hypothetical protein